MIKKISCMAIVVSNSKKVLVLNNEGEWVFPKGHTEPDEDFVQTAIRELKEETNIVVSSKQCLGQVDEFSFYFDGEQAIKVIKVFAFLIMNEPQIQFNQAEGFVDGKWLTFAQALETLSHDDAKNALKNALKKAKV